MIEKRHTFTIDYHSEEDDTDYRGQFTSRKLSMMDRSKINVRKSQLNGGMYTVMGEDGKPTGQGIDQETEFFSYVIAYLEVCLVQKPKWWDLNEISDRNVILEVFKEANEFENSFRSRGDTKGTGSVEGSQGSSEEKHAKANDGNVPKKVVDKQVQASLDP